MCLMKNFEKNTVRPRDGKQSPKTALDGVEREIRAIKERARENTPEGRVEQRKRHQDVKRNNRESEHSKNNIDKGYERER